MTAAVVGLSMLLASCGSDEGTPTTSSSAESSTTASAAPPSAAPSPEPVSPLEGTWRTPPISPRDAEAPLRQSGLAKWIKRFRPLTPFAADTVLILEIEEPTWNLYGKPKGEPRQEIDYDANYALHGNKVEVIHATGSTTFRWFVDGDTLTLEWLKSTQAPYKGIPDEVFQRALYMTEEFTK